MQVGYNLKPVKCTVPGPFYGSSSPIHSKLTGGRMWSPRTMFLQHIHWERTRNQSASSGIEANDTVGEASILRQVGGAFLPHPTLRRVPGSKTSPRTPLRDNPLPVSGSPAMLTVLSFFMQR
jgi:hypothetical protein